MSKVVQLGPWPAGMNNRAPDYALNADQNGRPIALRNAVNAFMSTTGHPKRRDGYTKTSSGFPAPTEEAPKLFNGRLYARNGVYLEYTDVFKDTTAVENYNRIPFEADITIAQPVKNGIWVTTLAKTYFLAGTGPEDFVKTEVLPYGALQGTCIPIPNSENVAWTSTRGVVVATSSGEAKNITEELVAMDSGSAGTAMIRQVDGVMQYVVHIFDAVASPLAAKDFVAAEIARRGA